MMNPFVGGSGEYSDASDCSDDHMLQRSLLKKMNQKKSSSSFDSHREDGSDKHPLNQLAMIMMMKTMA